LQQENPRLRRDTWNNRDRPTRFPISEANGNLGISKLVNEWDVTDFRNCHEQWEAFEYQNTYILDCSMEIRSDERKQRASVGMNSKN
jgi:hypothetical protein